MEGGSDGRIQRQHNENRAEWRSLFTLSDTADPLVDVSYVKLQILLLSTTSYVLLIKIIQYHYEIIF